MPPKRGTNKPDQSPNKATVSSPKPSAEDATALGSDKGSQSPSDAELMSHIKAARKADMRARHGLDQESRDYLRQQEKNRLKYQPTPTRKQTPTQSAKPSGAKSGTAGRKASSSPKGTSDRHMSVLTARLNAATGATTLGQDGSTRTARELGLPMPIGSGAKVRSKPAGAKTAAGGTPKSPKSPSLRDQFRTSFGVKPPPEQQLPTIDGIQRDEEIERNTPASRLEHPPDTERGADWDQLDDSVAMPPPARPKPAKAKAKAMSEPDWGYSAEGWWPTG